MISLADNSSQEIDFAWGLVISLNGADIPACEPILEEIDGPFESRGSHEPEIKERPAE